MCSEHFSKKIGLHALKNPSCIYFAVPEQTLLLLYHSVIMKETILYGIPLSLYKYMKSTKQQRCQCFQSQIKVTFFFFTVICNFWISWFSCSGNLKTENTTKQDLPDSVSEFTKRFLQGLLEFILAFLAVFQTYVYEIILTLIWCDEGKKRRAEWTGFQQMVAIVKAIYRITDELQLLIQK